MKFKKKKRQDDFQKVKLKVGKTKPKADNATNTNFRSKGIHLTEQLKRDTSGPTTHRQLGLNVSYSPMFHLYAKACFHYKLIFGIIQIVCFLSLFLLLHQDLMSQLHHYSANIKHSALLGLKELLSLNPSLLEQQLSRLVSEVAAVFTDKDGNVRLAATRVLRLGK